MSSIATGYSAALLTWANGPQPSQRDVLNARYMERWSIATGELFESIAQSNPHRDDPAIYANTKLLWKHSEAIVQFYRGVIYQGALSDEPEQGAMPVKPLVTDERATRLMLAINTLEDAWNWQQQMTEVPMYASALGDCLTELVDDRKRGFVYPVVVWPGYVRDIELDYVGNVQSFTLEYRVEERTDSGTRTYTYRKEVDKEAFRHFRDTKPYDKDGPGTAVTPNPYGFVPAVWDRHQIGAPGHVRGRSALDGTRQALLQLNSMFSHAFDYQRKAFFAPIMVAGGGRTGSSGEVDLSAPPGTSASEIAQSFNVLKVPAGAQLLQAQFDLGKTRELFQMITDNILSENPEAAFYARIREMTTVTAPGVAAAQGDVKNRVDLARAGYDSRRVAQFQMAITMGAILSKGAWLRDAQGRARPLTTRQQVFTAFDAESFWRGDLDFRITDRPLIDPSKQERLDMAIQQVRDLGIPLEFVLKDLDYDEDTIALIVDASQQAFNRGGLGIAGPIVEGEAA